MLNILFQAEKGRENAIWKKKLKKQKKPVFAKKIKLEPRFRFFFAKKLIFLKKEHFNALIYL
ncbi:hypothetical protein MNBD_GAMMA10-1006 [hydrothermal vent metagenome]|uniref:Uncharacterized protein n=1 Tax=hydrothermal vent metagenome TaxID=652676 RepID=A0A3B0Y6W0_9ZZZZ